MSRTPGNFARWVLKLLNPAMRAIAVSSMLNANAAFGSLALELRESQFPFAFLLSSFLYDPHEFNGRRKLNRPVRLIRKFPPASAYKSRICCEYIQNVYLLRVLDSSEGNSLFWIWNLFSCSPNIYRDGILNEWNASNACDSKKKFYYFYYL